jgi:hypothetical protein
MRTRASNTIAAIIALVLVTCAFWVYLNCQGHSITVVNSGMKPISALVVTVCGADYSFQNVPPGGQSHQAFLITGDSGFLVRGQFEDGVAIHGGFGYVTKNVSRQHVVVVVHDNGSVIGKQ